MDGAARRPGLQDRAAAADLHRRDAAPLHAARGPLTPDAFRPLCWIDGRILPLVEAHVPADDSAFAEGRGCYTTARIRGGSPRFAERHARRIERGVRALRLGALEPGLVERALGELGREAFPAGEGIVRLQASRDPRGSLRLVGVARPLADEPPTWRAVLGPLAHEGEVLPGGHKLTNRLVLSLALETAREAGADEALLLDGDGRLVEGSRSNIVVVGPGDAPVTPPLARGAVGGIARQLALERVPELTEGDVDEAGLRRAREIVAVNAVLDAVPVTRLDAEAVGDGRPGPWSRRLGEALAAD